MSKLVPVPEVFPATVEGPDAETRVEAPDAVAVGQWYWVRDPSYQEERWLGCAVHLGSNFVEVQGVHRHYNRRVHNDVFWECCTFEPNAESYIKGQIRYYQDQVAQLLGEVRAVTAQLAISPTPGLGGVSETQALAVRGATQPDMKEYGAALVRAKAETLPNLFEAVEVANKAMAVWMTAPTIPLKAQADGLTSIVEKIQDRIFSVELYAGLTEQVVQIQDGAPASVTEKVHLLQRRHYMDEECLAQYETGGMAFPDIQAFDAWLLRPSNLQRLLPFSRCVVAFRVRRFDKDREIVNLIDFFRATGETTADKCTFLYIRNGEQVFRLNTAIDFEEKLFPDLDRGQLTGKLWAKIFGNQVHGLITDNEYKGRTEALAAERKAWKAKKAAYEAALRSPEAKARAKAQGKDRPDAACVDAEWPSFEPRDFDTYVAFDRATVHYDDIAKHVENEISQHNRIALVLQGLLDRSPVFHPHPPWQIWTEAGFQTALELVYDESRALPAGAKPDFEAYRRRLNASLKVGSITVGQERAWLRWEAEKESERLDNDYRNRTSFRPELFRPYGDPGPGRLAQVHEFSKRTGQCTFAWFRDRINAGGQVRRTFSCPAGNVLNVSAYKPGDFHQFFDDPRTRAEYLEWAPLLLEAEEYHAGNRTVAAPPPPTKKEPSWEGQQRYLQQKRRQFLLGKAVRLTRAISTKGDAMYAIDTLWRVTSSDRSKFTIEGIHTDGSIEAYTDWESRRIIVGVTESDFKVDLTVPGSPVACRDNRGRGK